MSLLTGTTNTDELTDDGSGSVSLLSTLDGGGSAIPVSDDISLVENTNINFEAGGTRQFRLLHDEANNRLRLYDQVNGVDRLNVYQNGPVGFPNHDVQLTTGQALQDSVGRRAYQVHGRYPKVHMTESSGAGRNFGVVDDYTGTNRMVVHGSGRTDFRPGGGEVRVSNRSGNGTLELYDGNGSMAQLYINANGELEVQDAAGNATVIS